MHILTDAVLSSITPCGCGYFYFGNLTAYEVKLLQSITQRQRHKFEEYGMVPEQVLKIAFDYGWLPGSAPPKGGMNVKRLVNFLGTGPYRDAENIELAFWFREKIIQEEWKPKLPHPKNKNKRRPRRSPLP